MYRESTPGSHPTLNERTQHLLKALVERYIRDGQPVGSRTLARDAGLDLSPATVRNVMADLEELGYLHSPHTSAGRVPTARGYRFFIDALLNLRPLDDREVETLRRRIDQPVQGGSPSQFRAAPNWRGRSRTCCPASPAWPASSCCRAATW